MALLVELLGTFIGAALGFWTAFWLDYKRDQRLHTKRKRETIDSLLSEIDLIILGASTLSPGSDSEEGADNYNNRAPTGPDEGRVSVSFDIIYLPDGAFQSAIQSSGLALLPPDLRVSLSGFYEAVRLTRLHVDNLVTSYAKGLDTGDNLTFLQNAQEHLTAQCEFLLGQADEIRERLILEAKGFRTNGA